jgi:hypothetical protein
MNPEYPVYIISKGRWKNPQTAKSLEAIGVNYHIVIEPQEIDGYKESIDLEKIKILPFSNLGLGSIPARNWVWEDSIKRGFKRHWILDDNISGFCRYNNNQRIPVSSGTIFKCAEDFTDRYSNVALSGFQYRCFGSNCRVRPPFLVNTRIYSCILIDNSIPFRWRGRYNEDTDLSLRCLKEGYCTVLFMAFMQNKAGTMTMKGGNTDELYAGDGRKKMADSLVEQHPDVVTSTDKKYGRVQHLVNYKPFKKNKLKFKDDYIRKTGINEYGMKLCHKQQL